MYELTIKGDTAEQFYANAVNFTILLARGGNNMQPGQVGAGDTQSAPPQTPGGQPNTPPQGSAEPMADAIPATDVIPPKSPGAKRGPKPKVKPPITIEGTATDITPPQNPTDDTPDFLQSDAPAPAAAPLTLDGAIRPRIRAINVAHKARLATSGKDDGEIEDACVTYIKKLFAQFNIAKAADLTADKYEAFMVASGPYLAGSAS